MRKSALENQINIVIEKNNTLFAKCNELENQIFEKDKRIQELLREIEGIKRENQALSDEIAEMKANVQNNNSDNNSVRDELPQLSNYQDNVEITEEKSQVENVIQTDDNIDEIKTVHSIEELDIDNVSNLKSTLLANNKLDSASSAIGRVVLKCTEVCNTFVTAGDINSKDLVNLALGRTEVFKSEVLSLATSNDISIDMFNAELRLKETSVIEYFELLLKQI